MSFFGGAEAIIEKIQTYSHQAIIDTTALGVFIACYDRPPKDANDHLIRQEYNTPQLTSREHVEAMVARGADVLQRKMGSTSKLVEVKDCGVDVPQHILRHRDRFGHMIDC